MYRRHESTTNALNAAKAIDREAEPVNEATGLRELHVVYGKNSLDLGRRTATAPSMQHCPSALRHSLCCELYHDIDIVSCHPTLMLQVVRNMEMVGAVQWSPSWEKLAKTPSVGVKVMAPWTNGKLYPGKVSRVTGAGVVTILFDDGDKREGVAWTACTARATGTVSIHEAIRRKDLRAVKTCIESGRDVNVKGPDGNYPLASAAHDGLTEIVDTLLVNGAEVNKQAATGATALHYAAFRGHAACVRRLIDAGASRGAERGDGNAGARRRRDDDIGE